MGTDTVTVAAVAVSAMAIAANGKASFSLANAAVPKPSVFRRGEKRERHDHL
jgi:hypothetical protein